MLHFKIVSLAREHSEGELLNCIFVVRRAGEKQVRLKKETFMRDHKKTELSTQEAS